MDLVISLIRVLTAILAPIFAVVFIILTVLIVTKSEGSFPEDDQRCLRCEKSAKGGKGQFFYTENLSSMRERFARRPLIPANSPILGSESYFICDHCAYRYIRNEILQMILMVFPYPLYLYIIIPNFAETGVFANFLIETLLVVLSVGGFISALDLLRAVRFGETPLAEARDHVAIQKRKTALGKKFNYYTRLDNSQAKKRPIQNNN